MTKGGPRAAQAQVMSARSYEYPLTLTVQKSGGVVAARPGLLAGTMSLSLSLRPKQ